MVRRKKAKTATLVLVAILLVLALVMPGRVVLDSSSTLLERLCYPFMHATLLHALCNCWCLLSIVFVYDTSALMLLSSYLCSVSVPAFVITGPTVGFSGACFFLLGRCSWLVLRRAYFHAWAAAFMGMGFLIPNCAAWIHVYCYAIGVVVGYVISLRR